MEKTVQKCRSCGCSESNACAGGCSWIEPDLCSNCKLVEKAAYDLKKLLDYELGDYSIFEYEDIVEIEESNPESVLIYVTMQENGVRNVRFLMELKDEEAKDPTDAYEVSDKWKVSVELSEDNFEEIEIFNSSIKYLYMALLHP